MGSLGSLLIACIVLRLLLFVVCLVIEVNCLLKLFAVSLFELEGLSLKDMILFTCIGCFLFESLLMVDQRMCEFVEWFQELLLMCFFQMVALCSLI